MEVLLPYLYLVPAVVVAIPVHEIGHAAAAYLLGDRSVRYFGYFSLDPRRFLDPYGLLAVAVALVGWGRKVPVQPNRISSTGQKVLFELGGPAANLAVAIVLGVVLRFLPVSDNLALAVLHYVIYATWFLNVSLFAFQLLPIPGLDGWNILEALFQRSNPRFFFNVAVRRREIWAGVVIVLVGLVFLVRINLLNFVMLPFYEPASLISLGRCDGYVTTVTVLDPCLQSAR
ncbi:MAG TPA: site-2 protease family protein [Candidatus Dormibacteraeota bacterium]|nr:site-2 protease family protein [Candidatus Dormibacteraeota bacterium]